MPCEDCKKFEEERDLAIVAKVHAEDNGYRRGLQRASDIYHPLRAVVMQVRDKLSGYVSGVTGPLRHHIVLKCRDDLTVALSAAPDADDVPMTSTPEYWKELYNDLLNIHIDLIKKPALPPGIAVNEVAALIKRINKWRNDWALTPDVKQELIKTCYHLQALIDAAGEQEPVVPLAKVLKWKRRLATTVAKVGINIEIEGIFTEFTKWCDSYRKPSAEQPCPTCGGRLEVQGPAPNDELQPCPDCTPPNLEPIPDCQFPPPLTSAQRAAYMMKDYDGDYKNDLMLIKEAAAICSGERDDDVLIWLQAQNKEDM